jgi:hypothetical protein
MGAALPPGSAGVVAIYDRSKADTVDTTLASAVRKSVAQVDGGAPRNSKPHSPRPKPAWAAN